MNSPSEENHIRLRKNTTRRVSKLALKMGEKLNRKVVRRFEILDAKRHPDLDEDFVPARDFEKIAKAERERELKRLMKINQIDIKAVLQSQPVFYSEETNTQNCINLDPEIINFFPIEIFYNPTKWIESQQNISRHNKNGALPKGENIQELLEMPYDISKVKRIYLKKNNKELTLVSKRIDQNQSEIARAKAAYEAGIPTPKIVGEIEDQGNHYVLFENINGVDLDALFRILPIDQSVDCPYLLSSEEEFKEFVESRPFWNLLNQEQQNTIHDLWHQNLYYFLMRRAAVGLHRAKAHSREKAKKDIEDFFSGKMLIPDYLNKALSFYGFNNLDDYLDSMYSQEKDEIHIAMYGKCNVKLDEMETKWIKILQEAIYGIDLEAEIERLKKLCADKGIHHKDFKDRNMILEWDPKTAKPICKKGEKPRLFIIDWEQA